MMPAQHLRGMVGFQFCIIDGVQEQRSGDSGAICKGVHGYRIKFAHCMWRIAEDRPCICRGWDI